jgi:hypothetical protein
MSAGQAPSETLVESFLALPGVARCGHQSILGTPWLTVLLCHIVLSCVLLLHHHPKGHQSLDKSPC